MRLMCDPSNYTQLQQNQQSQSTQQQHNISGNIGTPASVYSCSLFGDNFLYPQLDYYVDLGRLRLAINDLNVQIGKANASDDESSEWVNYQTSMELEKDTILDCLVSTGILYDGYFWLQPAAKSSNEFEHLESTQKLKKIQQKVNHYIDELSKHVRRKRIGDESWQTFAEANRTPQINEKCFCLEPKTRKWMRASIVKYNIENKTAQLLLLDSGVCDSTVYSLESLIPWREDFDLAKVAARAVKCVLEKNRHNGDDKEDEAANFEKQIEQESRFLFRDLTAPSPIKCLLVKQIDANNNESIASYEDKSQEKIWVVKLLRYFRNFIMISPFL
jgi:hypothetical protein